MTSQLLPEPIGDRLLVELPDSDYGDIPTPEGKYASRTSGIAIKANNYLAGKTVYFEEYKDTIKTKRNGKTYAFIKYEDIAGFDETN